jgi:hypothetical protein
MNTMQSHLEIAKSQIETLLNEAQTIRTLRTQRISFRRRVARFLKGLALQLEPEPRTARG